MVTNKIIRKESAYESAICQRAGREPLPPPSPAAAPGERPGGGVFYENFLFAGIEAYAAETLLGYDDQLASNALHAAMEDYGFAWEKFKETGVDPAHMFEHTDNSGLSQYSAVIGLSTG